MGSFFKAEFNEKKGKFKIAIIWLAVVTIIFWGFLIVSLDDWVVDTDYMGMRLKEQFPVNLLIWSMPISVLGYLGLLIYRIYIVIDDYKSDFFTDRSYLKFTLPISSGDYLKAKISSILLWSLIVSLVGLVLNSIGFGIVYIKLLKLGINNLQTTVYEILQWPDKFKYLGLVSVNFSIESLFSLTLLYFSITFVKSFMRNSKRGGSWAAVYVIISLVVSYLVNLIMGFFPYVINYNQADGLIMTNSMYEDWAIIYNNGTEIFDSLSLPVMGFKIILIIVFLLSTYYLLEKKLEIKS